MLDSIYLLKGIFDPESLIRYGGLVIMFLIVYGQTGLFFCFFLPSGAVLFTAGVFVATSDLQYSIFTVCSILILAAFSGNVTGYWFGRMAGPLFYNRKESRFFKKEHLKVAETFYYKHGGVALMAGLFFPIIRTFAPIVAGILKVNFRRFILFTLAGSILWISSFISAGFLLGSMPALKPYLKYLIILIILIVTTPVVIGIIKKFKKRAE